MTGYLIRRTIQALIIIIVVSILIFFVIRMIPGDPIMIYISEHDMGEISPEMEQSLREEHGLVGPIPLQYIRWLGNVLRGNMGRSIYYREDVATLIGERFRVTLYIGSLAFIIGSAFGVFAGVIAALRRGTWLDTLFMSLANIGISAPNFWLGILLIYYVGFKLGWLPIHGYTSPFDDFVLSTRQAIMPVLVLAVFPMAGLARQTRSSILEVVRQDYIRTAWSKGLNERAVVFKHVLKNGLIPSVTMIGMAVPMTLGGQVIVENVFSIPGMGRLLVTSAISQDYPVVQIGILVIGIAVVLANLIVDIIYGWLDPRIRYN